MIQLKTCLFFIFSVGRDCEADIIFLLDSSESLDSPDYNRLKGFIKYVVSKVFIGESKVRIGLMQFSKQQKMEFSLNEFSQQHQILTAIDGLEQMKESTFIGIALTEVSRYFEPDLGGRPGVKQTLIVLTDGRSQDSVKTPAEDLRNKGVTLFAMGLKNSNYKQLLEIGGTYEQIYDEKDVDRLYKWTSELVMRLCVKGTIPEQEAEI